MFSFNPIVRNAKKCALTTMAGLIQYEARVKGATNRGFRKDLEKVTPMWRKDIQAMLKVAYPNDDIKVDWNKDTPALIALTVAAVATIENESYKGMDPMTVLKYETNLQNISWNYVEAYQKWLDR